MPTVDPDLLYLWEHWRELRRATPSGGMGANPISYADIEAYCRVTGEQFVPWEARAIRAIDDAYMTSLASQDGEGASDG